MITGIDGGRLKHTRHLKRSWGAPGIYLLFAPVLALAFFLGKPYHIDDVLFLRMADHLPPFLIGEATGRVEFLGQIYENLSAYESTHPPLIPYFLKWIGWLPGTEHGFWIYHLSFLIFPMLILAFAPAFSRARKLGPHWVWFLFFSPAFFVNATNLMTDVAMVCFWVISLQSLMLSFESNEGSHARIASLTLFLALMTSYQSVCLIPLMMLFTLVQGRCWRKTLLIIGIPVLGFMLYLIAVYLVSGFFPFLASKIDYNIASEVNSGLGLDHYLHKSLASLINLGLALFVPTPLLLMAVNRRRLLEHLIFASVLSFTLFHLAHGRGAFSEYAQGEILLIRILLLVGSIWSFQVMSKFVDGFRLLTRNRQRSSYLLLFAFWFLGVFSYNVLFMPYGTVRYILPAVPPALMLLFSHPIFYRFRRRDIPMLAASALVCILMAAIDYRQAWADYAIYQRVREVHSPQSTLWFSDDAGLNRYLKDLGGRYLPLDQDHIATDDRLLMTRGLINDSVTASLSLQAEWKIESLFGLTLFDTENRAGFYRSMDGLLPIAPAEHARKAYLFRCNEFLQRLDSARQDASNPNYIARRVFEFPYGPRRGVLFMHPDAKVGFDLSLDRETVLHGQAVTDPKSWPKAGDGVEFQLGVEGPSGSQVLWNRYLDGKNHPDDRTPMPFQVVLPADSTAVWFRVGAGPMGDYRYDGVGWLNLTLDGSP